MTVLDLFGHHQTKITGDQRYCETLKGILEMLQDAGWRVITVWECELKKKNREGRLSNLCNEIKGESDYGSDKS